jgi:hypothetical protein
MGTHNRLLGLGEGLYLELIAIDPQAPPPGRPRWFGLDRPQDLPADRPRLLHWVARSDDIAREAAASGEDLGEILSWSAATIAGASPCRPMATCRAGLVPTLIQWDVPFHPGDEAAGRRLPPDEAGGISIPSLRASVVCCRARPRVATRCASLRRR